MPRPSPYVQRRSDTLFFRIAVPLDLRPYVGGREITKTLRTTNRQIAIPRALLLASQALELFAELRSMSDEERDVLKAKYGFKAGAGGIEFTDVKEGDEPRIAQLLNSIDLKVFSAIVPAPVEIPDKPQKQGNAPLLSAVVKRFLNDDGVCSKKSMLAKHELVLPLLVKVIGDKPIDTIEQTDIADLFSTIRRLPTQWPNDLKKGLTIASIIDSPNRKKLSEETFNSYYGSIQTFLKFGRRTYPKQLSRDLSVEDEEYNGDRKKGQQQKQRAFTLEELKRIFEGSEMKIFADDPTTAHKFWLPHIGLFTGARINEICQMNPQKDIRQDKESGIWYFLLTEETEAHEDVEKSIKTDTTRQVPIHKKLIDLGLLDYVERVKKSGEKMLFPEWKPRDGRAASNAGAVFIDFLKKLRIHGEEDEDGYAIRGAHAFRHTLLTYGALQKPPLNLLCISGHAAGDLPIPVKGAAKGYFTLSMLTSIVDRAELLNQLDYGIQFHQPAKL